MTSAPSREDVQDTLFRSGVKNPVLLGKVMNVIDIYVLAQIRKVLPPEEIPPVIISPEKKYLCPHCGQDKVLEDFPPVKQDNPQKRSWCTLCMAQSGYSGKRPRWKCPSCEKNKTPEHFPEGKRRNPRLRAKCLDCDD